MNEERLFLIRFTLPISLGRLKSCSDYNGFSDRLSIGEMHRKTGLSGALFPLFRRMFQKPQTA
jgi:hypothetical protein